MGENFLPDEAASEGVGHPEQQHPVHTIEIERPRNGDDICRGSGDGDRRAFVFRHFEGKNGIKRDDLIFRIDGDRARDGQIVAHGAALHLHILVSRL